jgi:hypothetical protein
MKTKEDGFEYDFCPRGCDWKPQRTRGTFDEDKGEVKLPYPLFSWHRPGGGILGEKRKRVSIPPKEG